MSLVIFHFYLYMYVFLICFHMLLNKYVFFFCSIYNIWSSKTLFSHINFMVANFFFWGCWMLPGRSKFCSSTTGLEYFVLVSEVTSCKNLFRLLWFLLCKCGWHEQAEKYFPAPPLFFSLTFLVLNNLELTRISLCISLLCADATKLAKACQQQIAVHAVAP